MKTSIFKSNSLLLMLLLTLTLYSCKSSEDETFIRVKNISSYNFEDVIVITFGITFNYGDLEAGASSEYETFEHGSNIVSINLKIDGKDFYYFSPGYLGEQVFNPGNFTFIIGVDSYEDGTLSFEIDKE